MAEITLQPDVPVPDAIPQKKAAGSALRLARYISVRIVILFLTVIVGVYLTVLIANMGGYVDKIQRARIREEIQQKVLGNPSYKSMSAEERNQMMEELAALQEKRLGLDQPFAVRSFRFLTNALTLNLGWTQSMTSDSGSKQVRNIMLERLPPTLLLFAIANLLLFFTSVYAALGVSRRYGSTLDRFIVSLAPTGSAPGWFYGIFLIVIFAAVLRILPFGGMVSAPPPENPLDYSISLAQHMILPVLAIALSTLFLSIYNWRTFFLIYSSEDYVDMAKAKGLKDSTLERRYILRPTLPNIISTFALTLITLWQGAPILESVFNWPGLGSTIVQAIGLYETPVIVGTTVVFAYLLALTVFLLDFIYAIVDPRVKMGSGK